MATTTVMVDDLDSTITSDITTLSFSVEGVNYSIDLGTENYELFMLVVQPFVDVATEVKSAPVKVVAGGVNRVARDTKPIREWAKANGRAIGEKGRIASGIEEAYHAAMAKQAADKASADKAAKLAEAEIATPVATPAKVAATTKTRSNKASA